MDREQFDDLARLVWTRQTRRAALGAALGLALLGPAADPVSAKPNDKHKRQRRRKSRQRKHRPCFPGTNCIPGPGKDNAGCDFTGSTQFFEGDFQGSDLAHANLAGAQLAKADLSGADLGGACLVQANLRDADLAGADLDGAIFCQTLMPDGTIDDSGCDRGTRCCPTGCADDVCPTDCVRDVGGICSIAGVPCCRTANLFCTPSLLVLLTTCQMPCNNDEHCTDRLGPGWTCKNSVNNCPFNGPCCVKSADN